MTLNSISLNFQWISRDFAEDATTAKRMKIGQYCQRQRCKHVELEQFLAGFRVARVCQRQLGSLVTSTVVGCALFRGWPCNGDDRSGHVSIPPTWAVRPRWRRLPRDECHCHQTGSGEISSQLFHLRLHWRSRQGLPAYRERIDAYSAETEPGITIITHLAPAQVFCNQAAIWHRVFSVVFCTPKAINPLTPTVAIWVRL